MTEGTARAALARTPDLAREILPRLQRRLDECAGDANALEAERAAQAALFFALWRKQQRHYSNDELPVLHDFAKSVERVLLREWFG